MKANFLDMHTLPPHTHPAGLTLRTSAFCQGGDSLPGAKRIGWLKTSDFEGCKHPDEDFRKKERAKSVELES